MAKSNTPNPGKEYNALNRRTERYAALISRIFDMYNLEAAKIAAMTSYSPLNEKPFKFSDYPQTTELIKELQKNLASDLKDVIDIGIATEWKNSNDANDVMTRTILERFGADADLDKYKKYFDNNKDALDAFMKHKTNGMDLSKRIWNLTGIYKIEFELAISVGMEQGISAAQLSRNIRKYLKEPDKLFRRVRDKYGVLQLSKAAKAYNPGRGIYRSSYKNAMRLARTEINMAYRKAGNEKAKEEDFIVGFEIKRSYTYFNCPVCESLKGKYPKDFDWSGWHPQCRCYVVWILKTKDEFFSDSPTSVNEVKDVPDNFKKWVQNNEDRLNRAKEKGTSPYWVRDNEGYVNEILN